MRRKRLLRRLSPVHLPERIPARGHLLSSEKAKREAKDIQVINAHARRLNNEAADTLEYQAGLMP